LFSVYSWGTFLNPYFSVASVLLYCKCWFNLQYIAVSKTLEKTGTKETGLYLAIFDKSPFLCTGIKMAYFSHLGKTPIIIDLLKIKARGFSNLIDTKFLYFVWNPIITRWILDFRELIIPLISPSLIGTIYMCRNSNG